MSCGCKGRVRKYVDVTKIEPEAWDDVPLILGLTDCGYILPVNKPLYRIIRDTILVPQKVYIARHDTVFLPVKGDTVYLDVIVPIKRKEYRTDNYYAVIEGYKPSLVSMEVYQQTAYITKSETVTRIKKPRFGVGVQVRYGFYGQKLQPYVGVGIQYNVVAF